MTFDFVLLAGVACHFNPELQADPLDPPLCGDLEIFANGGGLSDLSPHFMELKLCEGFVCRTGGGQAVGGWKTCTSWHHGTDII